MSKFPNATDFRSAIATEIRGEATVFFGMAATGQVEGGQFSIIAPNSTVCRAVWDKLGLSPLDDEGLQKVALCAAHKLEVKQEKALFRVAALKMPSGELITETADNTDEEAEIERYENFAGWLTDWIEVEITE